MKCPACKKNIPDHTLKCPFCKTRTGLLCSECNTVNPIGNTVCENCEKELLKICKHCNSVNFPNAQKCRKCGSPFNLKGNNEDKNIKLEYIPKFYTRLQALNAIYEGFTSKEKKIISISGQKGIGKTHLLNNIIKNFGSDNYQWCMGRCTPLTQVTPGGVVQDMLLNLFNLPNLCINSNDLKKDALTFFSKNFRFLNTTEISEFFNFLYNTNDGNYEDIIINKKRTYGILSKIFDALNNTGKFIFAIDNFDFIDGFSAEFLNNFISKESNWRNIKFIIIYNEHKPVGSYFNLEDKDIEYFLDINLAPLSAKELENVIKPENAQYITPREKEVILQKSNGNPAFVEQSISYSFDCQISDKAFLLPNDFNELIKERLLVLKKTNQEVYKFLAGSAILGDKLNLMLLKEVFRYKTPEFNDILQYLEKSNFIRPHNDNYYEFNNLLLWETVLKNIPKNSFYSDLNVKIGKTVSLFNLNTNPAMAMIAHNLKENRMAFDIWTKITRLSAGIGDINLYVISQKQCLALINEFNENETLNIRYNISERLGKLLTVYDPEEAIEYLPDAISKARENNNDIKEIELLGYLAQCCQKTWNYFGNVECADNVLKKLKPSQELEIAMVKSTKLPALLSIGNSGEIVDLIDNDILPKLNNFLFKPRLDNTIPIVMINDTWLRVNLALAQALALQGNDRSFSVLETLFATVEKQRINDPLFICKAKLVLAYANTVKGDFNASFGILEDIDRRYRTDVMDFEAISRWNLIYLTNKFMLKDYEGIREELFDAVTYANNTADNFTKNLLKVFLGKTFKDDNKARHAIKIYDEQISYFAKEKLAFGALLTWYLIAEATVITENPKNAIDIANQALEIAQNPRINNYFFIVKLKIILALAYVELSDFETAKINIESAIALAKKYNMNDLLSRLYLLNGSCYQDIGTSENQNTSQYLKGALKMFDKALEISSQKTKNPYIQKYAQDKKQILLLYCQSNSIVL